ncbi:hypothetical protein OAK64_03375 [Deltaproteobacteria bacterium]|nr:hypothetical protein [Deltaproteobacteria bacterium]
MFYLIFFVFDNPFDIFYLKNNTPTEWSKLLNICLPFNSAQKIGIKTMQISNYCQVYLKRLFEITQSIDLRQIENFFSICENAQKITTKYFLQVMVEVPLLQVILQVIFLEPISK